MRIINCTPHDISIIDQDTKEVLRIFPRSGHALRGKAVYNKDLELKIDGIQAYLRPKFVGIDEEWMKVGAQRGEAVICSTISYDQYKHLADRDGVTLLIPASGDHDCLRDEKGHIVGSYWFYV